MKNKFYYLGFLASLALSLPAQAQHRSGGGGGGGHGGFGGGHAFASGGGGSHGAPSRGPSGRAMAGRFNGGGFNNARFAASRASAAAGPRMANGHFSTGGAHVFARQSAGAHPNWSHNHDHFWHGHHCRFVNGSWVVFDFGFYDPFYWGGYPWGYYGYGYGYPYGYPYDGSYNPYDQGVYEGKDAPYQGSDAGPSDENGSPVAVAQARLKRLGYYHGRIDGELGPATHRAITEYQRDHGLRVSGSVTPNTLNSMQARE
jgi:hypothetical protein